MTRVLPVLLTDLTKESTKKLLAYLNVRILEIAEESDEYDAYDPLLSKITTELMTRIQEGETE